MSYLLDKISPAFKQKGLELAPVGDNVLMINNSNSVVSRIASEVICS